MTRKIVDESVANIKYDLNGKTILEAIERLKLLATEHGETAMIDIGQECEPYSYSDDQYAYVRLYVKRKENDVEYEKRITDEKRWEDQRRQTDLDTYERVKSSLEGK